MSERWTLNAPIDVVWTPEDLAKICNAIRAMQAELRKFTVHVDVELNGVSILPPPEFGAAAGRNLFGRPDGWLNCPCGHPWIRHDVEEYRGDGTETCCAEGCDQVKCPGKNRPTARGEFARLNDVDGGSSSMADESS